MADDLSSLESVLFFWVRLLSAKRWSRLVASPSLRHVLNEDSISLMVEVFVPLLTPRKLKWTSRPERLHSVGSADYFDLAAIVERNIRPGKPRCKWPNLTILLLMQIVYDLIGSF